MSRSPPAVEIVTVSLLTRLLFFVGFFFVCFVFYLKSLKRNF